jgi:hypothetical protein
MKKILILLLINLISSVVLGQTKGLNFQAVIQDPKTLDIPGQKITGQPLINSKVWLKFDLINSRGELDYSEIQATNTDEFGLVNLTIGQGTSQGIVTNSSVTTKYSSFQNIIWDSNVKKLAVSVSFDQAKTFSQVSMQTLSHTAYALYAESVEYRNVAGAPTQLSEFTNDVGYLIPKDLNPLQNKIQEVQANAQGQFLLVNQRISTVDEQLTSQSKSISQLKSSVEDQNQKLVDQQNQIQNNQNQVQGQISNLTVQTNNTQNSVNNLGGTYESLGNKSVDVNLGGANPSNDLYPSQRATKSYVDNSIYQAVGSGVPDATTLAAGKIQLAGDLGGTAATPTVPGLANKENLSNKSISVSTDATSDTKYPSVKAVKDYVDSATQGVALQTTVAGKEDVSNKSTATTLGTSDILYPTQKAVKSYVDSQIASSTIVDADATTKGKIQLAGDLSGTAAAPTVVKINGVALAGLSTGLLKNTTSSGIPSIAIAGTDYLGAVSPGSSGNILTSNGTTWISAAPAAGTASTLLNARLIYGNSFDGSANVTGVIASNFGGTGNGFTKFTGATGIEKTYTLPNSDAVILTNQTAVTINQGGTGATNKTAAFDALSPMTSPGDIIYGISGGSAARLARGTENQVLTISNGLPAWTTSTATAQAQDSNEEASATLNQTSFTLAHTPATTSKVRMYINGIRISNTAYTISGSTVTYIPTNNGAYDLAVGDRIQFDYQY